MSAKERRTHPPQKRVINPIVMLAPDRGIPPPGDALLETAPPFFTAPTRGVRRYLAAFGSSDLAEPERLLADHAGLETTGTTSWYSGKATCVQFIAAQAIGRPADGRILRSMLPVGWRPAPNKENDQTHHSFLIVVLAALAVATGPAARRHRRNATAVRTDVTRTERKV
jgi:hypothetical protein